MDEGFPCDGCDKPILAGTPMWSVNVHKEVYEDGVINVLMANSAKIFCEECAESLDFSSIEIKRKIV